MVKLITSKDIGDGLEIVDDKLVVAGGANGSVVTVEDEVIHQLPQDGSIRIYKKFSNLPEYVQTNTGGLQNVEEVNGDTIFTYSWAFPETRTKYNSTTGELYEP